MASNLTALKSLQGHFNIPCNFFSDGQAIAIKISNQIGKVVNEMKRLLSSFNDLCENEVDFMEIKDPQFPIYSSLLENDPDGNCVSTTIKKRLVELTHLQDRCEEELSMVKEEMKTLENFIQYQIAEIEKYVVSKGVCENSFNKGLHCCLLRKQLMHKTYLQSLHDTWTDIIDTLVSNATETFFLTACDDEKVDTFWMHDCDYCNDTD